MHTAPPRRRPLCVKCQPGTPPPPPALPGPLWTPLTHCYSAPGQTPSGNFGEQRRFVQRREGFHAILFVYFFCGKQVKRQ